MLGQVTSGKDWLIQVMIRYARLEVASYVRLGHIKAGYARFGHVTSCYVWLEQIRTG
jgi:hypothetical protein